MFMPRVWQRQLISATTLQTRTKRIAHRHYAKQTLDVAAITAERVFELSGVNVHLRA